MGAHAADISDAKDSQRAIITQDLTMTSSTRKDRSPSSRSRSETEARFTNLVKPRSIISIKKGFEYFNGSHRFPSKASEAFFHQKREQAQRLIAIYKLNLSTPLPDSPIEQKKLWNEFIRPQLGLVKDALKYHANLNLAGISTKASLDSAQDFIQLFQAEISSGKEAALKRQREARARLKEQAAKQMGMDEAADHELVIRLVSVAKEAIQASLAETCGYLYLKAWVMQNGGKWYKVGVTTDLERRDAEQNVLPVPPSTLHTVRFQHIHQARAAERAFHTELLKMRIKGAKNKELFSLKPSQVNSIIEAMKVLGRRATYK